MEETRGLSKPFRHRKPSEDNAPGNAESQTKAGRIRRSVDPLSSGKKRKSRGEKNRGVEMSGRENSKLIIRWYILGKKVAMSESVGKEKRLDNGFGKPALEIGKSTEGGGRSCTNKKIVIDQNQRRRGES